MTKLLLIRHGQTAWNVERRIQGQLDVPLNEVGHSQAQKVARKLSALIESIGGLYTSDLQRAVETARVIGAHVGHQMVLLPDLREMHAGEAQGLELSQRELLYGPWRQALARLEPPLRWDHPEWPQGETANEVFKRTSACLKEVAQKHKGQTVLIVTHSRVMHTLISRTYEQPYAVRNCSIAYFAYNHSDESDSFLLEKIEHVELKDESEGVSSTDL